MEDLGWTDSFTGRPFTGNIDNAYCRERWDREGKEESFCEVHCHYDGSCTETVKQKRCSCGDDSVANEKCATVEYQVRLEILNNCTSHYYDVKKCLNNTFHNYCSLGWRNRARTWR